MFSPFIKHNLKCVHQFFINLTFIINVVVSSSKWHDEFQDVQAMKIQNMISNNEIETKKKEEIKLLPYEELEIFNGVFI